MSRPGLALAFALLSIAGCDRVAGALVGDDSLSTCLDQAAPPEKAIAACDSVIAANADKPAERARAYAYRGMAKGRKGDFEGGIADETATLALEPDNAFAYVGRGMFHVQRRAFGSALSDFNKAIALEPQSLEAIGNRAVLFQETGRFDEAVADFGTAIALAPGDFRAWNGRCWARAVSGRQLELALADCDQSIKLNPDDWNSHNSRGFVLFRMGRHADAVAAYDKAIAGDPNVASSWFVRGLAKRALGDASADSEMAKGVALEPKVASRLGGYGLQVD